MPSMPTKISFEIIDNILGDAPKKFLFLSFFEAPIPFAWLLEGVI